MNEPRSEARSPAYWLGELRDTFTLAWPLVIAQLASMALITTDVIMMGWLGPEFLAAGTLSSAFFSPILLFGVGVITAVAPLIAQSIGAGDQRSVRRSVRQGFWAAAALGIVLVPVLMQVEPALLALGQNPDSAAMASDYMRYAAWHILPAFGIIVVRSLLAAHNQSGVVLAITLAGVCVNFLANYALMFGNFGFPRLELAGAGIATSLSNLAMFGGMLAYVLIARRYRVYQLTMNFWRPDWQRFRDIFRIGFPIGLMIAAEVGLFGAATILMGWLGTEEVAAHAVALQCASLAFMVPLGLSQAATIRVGIAFGGGRPEGVRTAGWSVLIMGVLFMATTCTLFVLFPGFFVALYLDAANPDNLDVLTLAATFLGIAGMFQLFDGAQVVAAGALRGLSDTRAPMITAFVGYWLVGLPVAWLCGFVLEMGGTGIWFGLASGLGFVALVLTTRFALRERFGLVPPTGDPRP